MGQISEIFSDATTLEINSILVDGISGRKMSGIRIAFFEVVHAWNSQCDHLIARLEGKRPGVENPPEDPLQNRDFLLKRLAADTEHSFQSRINKALEKTNRVPDELTAEIRRLIKLQIRLISLKLRFEGYLREADASTQEVPVADRAMQELRKLWELKDGYIFAQNVMQLDGDVISRYNRRIYRDPQAKAHVEQLINFHNLNVLVGVKHWQFLIDMIFSMAKTFGEKITNPFR